jgi:uncharacterized DUF497 family protein
MLLVTSSMPSDLIFEWHHAKARSNLAKHGISFGTARQVFFDPFMVEVLDDTEDYGEDRFLVIGMVEDQLLSVIYTPRRGRYRLISARCATRDEQDHYFTQNSRGSR